MCETGNIWYNLASIDPTNGNYGQASTDEKQSNTNGTKCKGTEWNETGERGIVILPMYMSIYLTVTNYLKSFLNFKVFFNKNIHLPILKINFQ